MRFPPEMSTPGPLELWAGVECSVVRVDGVPHDQLERGGHSSRAGDLERIAGLGIRALRYPVLWERTAPDGLDRADWSWAEERLGRLRDLKIRPIVGLVHHGCGPLRAGLVGDDFAEGLALYAGALAERFPWVEDYTPINEPMTTARFSGLYGVWHPHGRDDRTFLRALMNECRATALAMRAIRRVNPAARLVQTEDLGKVHATPAVAYQAAFENERRWLGFDLLCGRVDPRHPLWNYLLRSGATERELALFREEPCPPDLFGANYYVTSERFLDERIDVYPPELHGGNGRHTYADVEAVRVRARGIDGLAALLREAWARYRIPIAVTEAHLGGTRDEQLRWLREIWDSARDAREAGVDVRAVTVWAVLGSHDWDSLLTRRSGHYEPGAFDVRTAEPRPTALAGLASDLASGREPDHPALDGPGWWRRPERLLYPSPDRARPRAARAGANRPARKLAILGANGRLGRAFARLCALRGLDCESLSRGDLDLTDPRAVVAMMDRVRPWAVVNAAGFGSVDRAEAEPDGCRRVHVEGPRGLASCCARLGIGLVGFSSAFVFDGDGEMPYVESHPHRPRNVYGRSHSEMEAALRECLPDALVIRAGCLFGPWDADHLIGRALHALGAGRPFEAPDDLVISPTYLPDLVHAALDLMIDGERGVWHMANSGAVTWADLARRAAELGGLDPSGVAPLPSAKVGLAAPRPRYSALASERAILLSPWEEALARYFREREASVPEASPRRPRRRPLCA